MGNPGESVAGALERVVAQVQPLDVGGLGKEHRLVKGLDVAAGHLESGEFSEDKAVSCRRGQEEVREDGGTRYIKDMYRWESESGPHNGLAFNLQVGDAEVLQAAVWLVEELEVAETVDI